MFLAGCQRRIWCSNAVKSLRGYTLIRVKYSSNVASHHYLPTAKMRALISLYHQANTFVTPENLDQKIEQAFFGDPSHQPVSRTQPGMTLNKLSELESEMFERRKLPKMSLWDREKTSTAMIGGAALWSGAMETREQQVVEALYGVNFSAGKNMPGLEVLNESLEGIEQQIMTDEEVLSDRGVEEELKLNEWGFKEDY